MVSPKHPGRFKAAIWKSLRRTVEREAKRKAGLEIAIHEAIFEAAREFLNNPQPSAFSPETSKALAAHYHSGILAVDEVRRRGGLGIAEQFKIPASDMQPPEPGMSRLALEVYSKGIEVHAADIKDHIARFRSPDRIRKMADILLSERGIDPTSLSVSDRRTLETELMKAERLAAGDIKKRLEGEDIPTPSTPALSDSKAPTGNSWTISKAFLAWADGGGIAAIRCRGL